MKIKQDFTFFLILAAALLACATLYLWSGDSVVHISSTDGTRDLRGVDSSTCGFDLCGPVDYIPNALLTPEEFAARQSDIQTGAPAKASRFSTSRLRIYLPVGTYGLMMLNAEFATNIFVNGQPEKTTGV